MCLAVPGRITEVWTSEGTGMRVGRVDFGGVAREVSLAFVPEANVGDYVLIHVGFALSRIDEAEAHKTLELLSQTGLMPEGMPQPAEDIP